MNIREIEQQLGIPRANIRYYEKEGPDEDVQTLKKIRLLRHLDMPIETIRAVQAGEVLQPVHIEQHKLHSFCSFSLLSRGKFCGMLLITR